MTRVRKAHLQSWLNMGGLGPRIHREADICTIKYGFPRFPDGMMDKV